MSTHLPGFQSFSAFLHHFVLAELATSSIRVKWTVFHHVVSSAREREQSCLPAQYLS